jgi:hypothetical protein
MHIVRVLSNVKGGVNAILGPKTYLVGRNESGKSAVINSIELALTGRASHIYGRETAAERELLNLLAPEGEALFAQVEFNDGSRARFEMGKGKAAGAPRFFDGQGLERPNLPWDMETVMPLRPLTDAIAGKADTTRKFFLHFAVGSLSDKDVLDRVPPNLHARLRQSTMTAKPDTATVDKLLIALETAEKKVRECKATAKAASAAEQKTGEGLGIPPTQDDLKRAQEDVERVKAELAAAYQRKGQVAAAANAPALIAQQQTLIQHAEQAKVGAAARIEEIKLAGSRLAAEPAADGIPRAEMLVVLDWHARDNENSCNVCGRQEIPFGFFAARKAQAQQMAQARLTLEDNWKQLRAQHDAAVKEWHAAANEIAARTANIAALQQQAGEGQAMAAQVDADLQRLEAAQREAQAKLDGLRNTAALWESSNKARDAASQATQEQKDWELLVIACKDAVKAFLDAGQERIVQWTQMRLPPGDRFLLKLKDSKNKPVFRFGLERDGRLDVALSDGKWAHVLAAMADVCKGEGYSLIVPDDRGFDPSTLSTVLFSLGSCTSQVVVHSTTRAESVPEGWTVVDADKGEHRVKAQANGSGGFALSLQ